MKLHAIHAKNFFSHRNTVLDFDSIDSPVLISGPNGSGKSSIVSEALTYAIFGETRLQSADDIIRYDADEMSVLIDFELSGQTIVIKRSKKRGKTQKLELMIDGDDVSELLTETQVRVNRLFGLSYNAFLSTVVLKQSDSEFFINQKPDERKKIVAEILNLNEYERLEKIARDQRQEIKSEIKAEQNVLNVLPEENLETFRESLNQVEDYLVKAQPKIVKTQTSLDEITARNAIVTKEKERHTQLVKSNQRTNQLIVETETKLQDKIDELEGIKVFLQEFVDPEKDIARAQTLIEKDETALIAMRENLFKIEVTLRDTVRNTVEEFCNDKIKPLETRITEIDKISQTCLSGINLELECSTCKRPFADAAEKKAYQKELQANYAAVQLEKQEIQSELRNHNKALDILQKGKFAEAEKLEDIIEKNLAALDKCLKTSDNHKAELREYLADQRRYDIAQNRQNGLQEALGDLKIMLGQLTAQLHEIKPQTFEFEDDSIVRQKLMQMLENEKEALKLQTQLRQNIDIGTKNNERRATLINGLNSKLIRLGLLEKLCVAFSRNGIPASIIANVLPEIEDTANEYLARISDNGLSLRFNTIETLKNGEKRETLEIEVFDGQAWRVFESFSGGEKFRVSLSIRLALSRVLTSRAGVELELLVLDEPASALDAAGREMFASIIKSLKSCFSTIIIISHLDLAEEFSNRIHLDKSEDGTRLTQ